MSAACAAAERAASTDAGPDSGALLDKLAASAPGAFFQLRRDSRGHYSFPYASPGMRRLFGLEPGAVQHSAQPVFAKLRPLDLAAVLAALDESARHGAAWQQEFGLVLPDGQTRWLDGHALPEALPNGDTAWYGYFGDATPRKEIEQALHSSVLHFRHFFENNTTAMLLVDPRTGRFADANAAACRYYGYSHAELMARNISDINILTPAEIATEMARAQAESCNYFNFRHRLASGEVRDVEVYSTPTDVGGNTLLFSSVHDVTERKSAEARLKLAASVFLHAREGIVITDAQGVILDVNDTFTRITGYPKQQAVGHTPRILQSDRHTAEHYAFVWKCLQEKGHWYGEMWNRRPDGTLYAVLETISAVRDEAGAVQAYVGLMTDITAMKEHERQLERVAHYDALTHLPNRILLFDRLAQAIARSQREGTHLAVAFMDLDGFKSINDQFGHTAGDHLLIEIARRLKLCLREGDTLARIGGDEFVAILADLSHAAEHEAVIDRLLQAAARPVRFDAQTLQVTASIGVTLFPQDASDADRLLRHADQAMYQAKQSGKNRYQLFDLSHDFALQSRQKTVEQLAHAMACETMCLHYQPKIDLLTGEVTGWEALLRWNHPERGLLYPAEFLPDVAEHPIGIEIGEWVTRRALADMQQLHSQMGEQRVSVNLSAHELQGSVLIARLHSVLASHPTVAARQLEFEVLESAALEDVAKAGSVMRACHAMGVRFALDDFGTGYSSLTYLKHLPAEVLKIDKSFVHGMLEDASDRAIVQGIIGLARAFGKEVIAEGVESREHAHALRALGCREAQGYAIARPMPPSEMPRWMSRWHAVDRQCFIAVISPAD